MHIAICDDNVADRKQLERLLAREADARLKEGNPLYIDSFGNRSSLMHAPHLYDVFYIDMTANAAENGLTLASVLREARIEAPIVLCSSKISYSEYDSALSNLLYLDKPIKTSALSDTITTVLQMKSKEHPTFELREHQNTRYIEAEDFQYAKQLNERQSLVYLMDNSVVELPDSLHNLSITMQHHPALLMLSNNYLINSSYIKKISFTSITLTDNSQIPLRFGEYFDVKKILKNF